MAATEGDYKQQAAAIDDVETMCSLVMMCGRTLCHPHGLRLIDVVPTCNTCSRSIIDDDAASSSQGGKVCCVAQTKEAAEEVPSSMRHRLTLGSARPQWYCAFGAESSVEVGGRAVGGSLSGSSFVSLLDELSQNGDANESEHALSRIEESCWGDVWWRALEQFLCNTMAISPLCLSSQPLVRLYSVLVWVQPPKHCIDLHAHEWNGPLLPVAAAIVTKEEEGTTTTTAAPPIKGILHRALVVDTSAGERWFLDMTSARLDVRHPACRPLCEKLEYRPGPDDDFAVYKWAPPSIRPLRVCTVEAVSTSIHHQQHSGSEALCHGGGGVTPNLCPEKINEMATPIFQWLKFCVASQIE